MIRHTPEVDEVRPASVSDGEEVLPIVIWSYLFCRYPVVVRILVNRHLVILNVVKQPDATIFWTGNNCVAVSKNRLDLSFKQLKSQFFVLQNHLLFIPSQFGEADRGDLVTVILEYGTHSWDQFEYVDDSASSSHSKMDIEFFTFDIHAGDQFWVQQWPRLQVSDTLIGKHSPDINSAPKSSKNNSLIVILNNAYKR